MGIDETGGITLTYQLTIGSYGRDAGQFAFPQMITVDRNNGQLYVGDLANRRIQIFDYLGNFVRQLSPNVADWQVMGIALGPDGSVYAADAFNQTVWVFTTDGQNRRFSQ